MRINLTDNNINKIDEGTYRRTDVSELFPIANKNIADLCKENENLLVFPYNIEDSDDRIGSSKVLDIDNTDNPDYVRLTTGNVMGFIGVGNLKIKIKSRFDKGHNDYFLHYMLQKVLSYNLFDLNHNSNEEDVFDFIMFMFPYFLKSAMRQGVYREYQRQEHDDNKVKGVIDINRFIRQDIPFAGKIACSTRNYSRDNDMTQLIRHTIEFMQTKKYGQSILNIDRETIENVKRIIYETPSYNKGERNNIIRKNLRPKVHPFYTEYKPLQSLCIQILRMEEVKFGEEDDEICGVLFDGAWLWEEYVNTVIKNLGFNHPENKLRNGGIKLLEDIDEFGKIHNRGDIYPDFYKDNFILDAKYKKLGKCESVSGVNRDDIYQLISYMTRLNADKGGFISPFEEKQNKVVMSRLKETEKMLYIYGIYIEQSASSYEDFKLKMKINEDNFIKSLNV